jgi:hypothetical protein
MFDFFRKKEVSVNAPANNDTTKWAALKSAIEAQKKTDPLVGLKIGAKEINQRLINGLKNEKGVHIESFLTVLGALAGFSCQMSVREEMKAGMKPGQQGFVIADGADGKKYYFGDALNKPLAEDKYSIWSVAAGTTQKLGAPAPDVTDIFKHVAATVGGGSFGVPRTPNGNSAGDLPVNYLKVIWPNIFPVVTRFCDRPSEWPVLFAIAVGEALTMGKDIVNPGMGAAIVMESAIPMSKIDLPELY